MGGFSLATFKRLLSKGSIDCESILRWLMRKRQNCENQLHGAWLRVEKTYGSGDYSNAMEYINNLYCHIKWYDVIVNHFNGLLELTENDACETSRCNLELTPENIHETYNLIRDDVLQFTKNITKSYLTLHDFLILNNVIQTPPSYNVRYSGPIAYCTLHKINLNYSRAKTKNCFHRNGKSMCSNLLITRGPFWQTGTGQALLKSTAISDRVRFRKDS